MANLTREQIEKFNKGNENNFFFNCMAYISRNEKQLVKDIKIENDNLLRVELMFTDHYERIVQTNGVTYNKNTFKKVPTIWFTVWQNASAGMMRSYGLGWHESIGEAVERQSYKTLQNLSKQLTTATCLQLFEDLKKRQSNKMA